MYCLACANQKGGQGKTTTAINLAGALAGVGEKVLLVDLDPQHSVAAYYHVTPNPKANLYHGLIAGNDDALPPLVQTGPDGFDLLLGSEDLLAAERQLGQVQNRVWQFILKEKLRAVSDLYDWVILDCPPSLGPLFVSALAAADGVLVPVAADFLSYAGLTLLVQTIGEIRKGLNPELQVVGVLINAYETRLTDNHEIERIIRGDRYPDFPVLNTVIPKSVVVSRASITGHSLSKLAQEGGASASQKRFAELYEQLSKEVRSRVLATAAA